MLLIRVPGHSADDDHRDVRARTDVGRLRERRRVAARPRPRPRPDHWHAPDVDDALRGGQERGGDDGDVAAGLDDGQHEQDVVVRVALGLGGRGREGGPGGAA